MNCKDSQHGD